MTGDYGVYRLLDCAHDVEDLTTAVRGSLLIAEAAHVSDDHDDVRPTATQVRGETIDNRHGVVEPEALDHARFRGRRRAAGEQPDHADLERPSDDQRVVANPGYVAAVGVPHIGAEH